MASETGSTTALLFDRDEVVEVDDWGERVDGLRPSSILWVDLTRPGEDATRGLAEPLGLEEETVRRLADPPGGPYFGDFGSYIHVTAYAPTAAGDAIDALVRVSCLVAKRWVVTVHEGEIPVLDSFRERAEGSGDTGRLHGLEFVASLLEWVLEGYLEAFEEVEVALEEIDAQAMAGELDDPEAILVRLVQLRRQIGRLRRALVSHRQMFLSLTRPEVADLSSQDTAERFDALRLRLEDAIQAARDSRDSVVGSFDVLIARTGYRTNEIMKVLTLASVLLLPGALIAGVLGMNFQVGLFDHAGLFWAVVAFILSLAALTLLAARMRRWI